MFIVYKINIKQNVFIPLVGGLAIESEMRYHFMICVVMTNTPQAPEFWNWRSSKHIIKSEVLFLDYNLVNLIKMVSE